MKRIIAALTSMALVIGHAGCSASGTDQDQQSGSSSDKTIEEQLRFTDRDRDPSYDEASATKIELDGTGASVKGEGATADGSTVTISTDGTYVVSGTLADGQIVVSLPGDNDKAQIVLDGATIHNEDGPAIQVDQADKVFLTLADGSSNALSDGASYALAEGEDEPYAALYSKDDLTINGSGALEVTGNYRHGIASKDDTVITGGTITITSVEDAVRGNDAIKIGGGKVTVNARDDAFHSEYLFYIADGTVNVESCVEGYEAEKIIVHGGETSIVASDDGVNASAAEDSTSTDDVSQGTTPQNSQPPAMPQGDQPPAMTQEDEGTPPARPEGDAGGRPQGAMAPPDGQGDRPQDVGGSQDGAGPGRQGGAMTMPGASEECLIQINGGTLVVNADGDGLDSNGYIEINGGTVFVNGASNSDDSGLDYKYGATVNGGNVILMGSAAMAEDFTGGTQTYLMERISGNAGTTVEVMDASGAVIVSYASPKAFQAVTASAPGCASIAVR